MSFQTRIRKSWMTSPAATWNLIVGYLLAHAITTLIILPHNVWNDEAEQVYLSQWLDIGSFEAQPPLFTWIYYLAFSVFGINLYFIVFFKTALILLTYRGVFNILRLASGHHAPTVVSGMLSLAFIFQLWDETLTMSHTLLVSFASVWSVYMVMRISENGARRDYLLLGFFLGVGFLSKYVFIIGMLAMIAASLSLGKTRKALLSRSLLISISTFALVTFIHASWLAQHTAQMRSAVDTEVSRNGQQDYLVDIYAGAESYLSNMAAFIGVWVLAMIIFFRAGINRRDRSGDNEWAGFFTVYLLAITLLMIMSIFVFRVTSFQERYFQPFYIFIPVSFFVRYGTRIPIQKPSHLWFRRLSVATLVLIFLVNAVPLVLNPVLGRPGFMNTPYDRIAKIVEAETGDSDLVVVDKIVFAGNLKFNLGRRKVLLWSDSSHVKMEMNDPRFRSIVFVWIADDRRSPDMLRSERVLKSGFDSTTIRFRRVNFHMPPEKQFELGIARLPEEIHSTPMMPGAKTRGRPG